jgi:phosphoribosyl-AMP cyclohydrolase
LKALEEVTFDINGLVPAIVQDAGTGEVLMFAYMNREALELTIRSGETHFYSRSRKKLWHKGETSGNVQSVTEVRTDCDSDTILVKVRQKGGACHLGYMSCFFRKVENKSSWKITESPIFDPKDVYKKE